MDYTISIIRVRGSEQRLGFADEKAYERKLAGLLDAMDARRGNYPYVVRAWKYGELEHEYQA